MTAWHWMWWTGGFFVGFGIGAVWIASRMQRRARGGY